MLGQDGDGNAAKSNNAIMNGPSESDFTTVKYNKFSRKMERDQITFGSYNIFDEFHNPEFQDPVTKDEDPHIMQCKTVQTAATTVCSKSKQKSSKTERQTRNANENLDLFSTDPVATHKQKPGRKPKIKAVENDKPMEQDVSEPSEKEVQVKESEEGMETDEMVEPETLKKMGEPAVDQIPLKTRKGWKKKKIPPVKSGSVVIPSFKKVNTPAFETDQTEKSVLVMSTKELASGVNNSENEVFAVEKQRNILDMAVKPTKDNTPQTIGIIFIASFSLLLLVFCSTFPLFRPSFCRTSFEGKILSPALAIFTSK